MSRHRYLRRTHRVFFPRARTHPPPYCARNGLVKASYLAEVMIPDLRVPIKGHTKPSRSVPDGIQRVPEPFGLDEIDGGGISKRWNGLYKRWLPIPHNHFYVQDT